VQEAAVPTIDEDLSIVHVKSATHKAPPADIEPLVAKAARRRKERGHEVEPALVEVDTVIQIVPAGFVDASLPPSEEASSFGRLRDADETAIEDSCPKDLTLHPPALATGYGAHEMGAEQDRTLPDGIDEVIESTGDKHVRIDEDRRRRAAVKSVSQRQGFQRGGQFLPPCWKAQCTGAPISDIVHTSKGSSSIGAKASVITTRSRRLWTRAKESASTRANAR
jgi:hypothetical protein